MIRSALLRRRGSLLWLGLIVVLALVWTQFPFGSGDASAEGGHELALCCAWGRRGRWGVSS